MLGAMMSEYSLFLMKVITIVVAIVVVLVFIVSLNAKQKTEEGKIVMSNLSEKLIEQQYHLEEELLESKELKQLRKQRKQKEKEKRPRLFVLEFNGDTQASQVDALREEVTAILTLATAEDEVLIKLESPGGSVYGYGLAASQLRRIKDNNIPLTIAVDKVAASGGYMMACVADKIVAAPFAVVGSIGVVAEVPNIHRLLKKNDIDVDVMTAGKYKRTVTLLGENTQEGKEKFQQELEEVHYLFKNFVEENRSVVDIDQVATGEAWYGIKAKELKLIDEITTSDDIILQQLNQKDIFLIQYEEKKSLISQIGSQIEKSATNLYAKIMNSRGNIR